MRDCLSIEELKDLVHVLQRQELRGQGIPVKRVAQELRVSRDFIYDCLNRGMYFERLPGPRPLRITARSVLRYVRETYHGAGVFDAWTE